MIKLLKNLKWIDYVFILLICGLVGLQVFLDLKLPDYMLAITTELENIKFGIDVNMQVILSNGGYMLACAFGSLATAISVHFFSANISSKSSPISGIG